MVKRTARICSTPGGVSFYRDRRSAGPQQGGRLQNSRMDEIFQTGLHEFIGAFVDDNNRLGSARRSNIWPESPPVPMDKSRAIGIG
jgi:hypothetical protein